jgi:hypothetical protein
MQAENKAELSLCWSFPFPAARRKLRGKLRSEPDREEIYHYLSIPYQFSLTLL